MKWLIFLLLASFPLGHLTRVELTNAIAFYFHDLVAAMMLLAVFISSIKEKKLPPGKLTKPILIFILIAAISLLLNINTVNTKQAITGSLYLLRWTALSGIYFYLLKYRVIHKKLSFFGRSFNLGEALLLSGLALTAFGLIQYIAFPDLTQLKWLGWDDHLFRLTGTILDPGFTGILLVLTIFLAMITKLTKPIKAVAIGLPTIALLLTYSRASYLSFIAGFMVFVYLKGKIKKGMLLSALFIVSLFFLPRASSAGTELTRVFSIVGRIQTWSNAITIAKDNPVSGVGFNLLRYTQRSYGFVGDDWETSHSASGIDNSYLFVLATTGVLGLVIYLSLLQQMVKIFVKNKGAYSDASILALASLTAVCTHAFFNNSWFYPWVLIWIWYLLAAIEPSNVKKKLTPRK